MSERARAVAVWLLLLEHERRIRLWACKITSAHRLVAVAGPIATMLAGAAVGAAAGRLIGALVSKGVPEAERAEEVMKRNGAADIQERRDQRMRLGWKGRFDAKEGKAPLTLDEEAQPDVRLAAVCVYDIVIELPAQYGGPERRKAQQAYSGVDRRAA